MQKSMTNQDVYLKIFDIVHNQVQKQSKINELTSLMTVAEWTTGLASLGVPVGPINNIQEALEDPQVKHRHGVIKMAYPSSNSKNVELLGNPIKFSSTLPF